MNRKLIIVGGAHHNTLGVIRAIGQAGHAADIELVIERADHSVSKSKYLRRDHIHRFDTVDQIPAIVESLVRGMEQKPVVICCGDPFIDVLDSTPAVAELAVLPHGKAPGDIHRYMSKDLQRRLGVEVGMDMPRQFDSPEAATFPCIVKPLNSTSGSKEEITICRSADELQACLAEAPASHRLTIESFIEKDAEFQLIGCALPGQTIIPGYTTILRQPENTNTGYLRYSPIGDGFVPDSLVHKVRDFIGRIGYRGLFSIEFLRGSDGCDYFLEINMRNDGNAYCVTTAGVNLPYLWYKYADKPEAEITERTTFDRPVYWLPEADLKSIKTIGPRRWLSQWFAADSHAFAASSDPLPFIDYLYRLLRRHL